MKKKDISVNKGKVFPPNPQGAGRKTAVRFKSLADIRRFLGRVCNDLADDKIEEGKARTLGYLCSVLRDIIKDSDLEARVLKLEKEGEKNGIT